MSFEEFLLSKKIDSLRFQKDQPQVWEQWKVEFDQMHPNSFTAQKLFSINSFRRKYLITETQDAAQPTVTTTVARPKPVIKPKMN
jgi:hypothetical protein